MMNTVGVNTHKTGPATSTRSPFAIKAFERAFVKNGMYRGNGVTDVQRTWYVRGKSELDCNGFKFKPGELLETDLKFFTSNLLSPSQRLPDLVERAVREHTNKRTVILCQFGYWSKSSGQREKTFKSVGWVVTTTEPEYKILAQFPSNEAKKAQTFKQALAYFNYC